MVPPILRIGFWQPIYDAVELVLRAGRPLRQILVIDDGVASVSLLGVFRRRGEIPLPAEGLSSPFAPFFKGKQLIVFVTAQPTDRLDECDILIEVNCTEDIRLRNLQRRNADAGKRISDTAGYRLVKPKARAEFEIENDGEVFALRSG